MATSKKKVKAGRVIAGILIVIGGYTVVYNTVTLVYEVSRSVIVTVSNHNWNPINL